MLSLTKHLEVLGKKVNLTREPTQGEVDDRVKKGVHAQETLPSDFRICLPSRCGGSSLGLGCIKVKGNSTATSLKHRQRPSEAQAERLGVQY